MKTRVLKVNDLDKNISKIREAAEVLRKGGFVAFPTETVYGLGANALDADAVRKIFEAKGRPADNPLIVHVSDVEEIKKLVKEIPDSARKLIDRFWPGPLTLVFKKSEIVPDVVTARLNSVAIRMPSHPIALALIKEAGVPIAPTILIIFPYCISEKFDVANAKEIIIPMKVISNFFRRVINPSPANSMKILLLEIL